MYNRISCSGWEVKRRNRNSLIDSFMLLVQLTLVSRWESTLMTIHVGNCIVFHSCPCALIDIKNYILAYIFLRSSITVNQSMDITGQSALVLYAFMSTYPSTEALQRLASAPSSTFCYLGFKQPFYDFMLISRFFFVPVRKVQYGTWKYALFVSQMKPYRNFTSSFVIRT